MNASFESLFIFLLSKLRLPQVYCEPYDEDKSYIARSITLASCGERFALCRLRAVSNFVRWHFAISFPSDDKKSAPFTGARRMWCTSNKKFPEFYLVMRLGSVG